ncbi:MAG TPA: biosynthetic peptidoglycan transglycosylase [Candidatus Acidoferrales bacterium]|nr:biosynthetic peptidoglycan transglycosylase [Candidatus Acidoferrales bacterium]
MAWPHRSRLRPRKGHSIRLWLARTALVGGGLVAALLLGGLGYELSLPPVGDAQARVAEIVGAHHGELGGLPVPSKLGKAVVAVEDEHFYANVAVNVFDGVARAAVASLHPNGDAGGSTIDQQLAKQIYGQGTGLSASLRELALGMKLSVSYSSARILAMYLNVLYYGSHYWGDVAASRGYFGLSPDRLDWAQAAMLAGLPQAPSAYDPQFHSALAKQRQLHVLNQLVANHDLTREQAHAAYREPLKLRGNTSGSAG